MRASPLAMPLALLVSSLAAVSAAAGWVPVPCEDRASEVTALRQRAGASGSRLEAWEGYERRIRDASPGDPEYVPHPYPKTESEIFEDFRYAFLNRLVQNPKDVAPRHRRTFDALQAGTLHYEIVRVENWEPQRCGVDQPRRSYFLLRLVEDGTEIARCALHRSGLFSAFMPRDHGGQPLEDLSNLGAIVQKRFGVDLKPSRGQFVALSGLPEPCLPLVPCVAFQAAGKVYLVNRDCYLFVIEPGAAQLSILELAERPIEPLPVPVNEGRAGRPWITVGFSAREGRLVALGPRGKPLE